MFSDQNCSKKDIFHYHYFHSIFSTMNHQGHRTNPTIACSLPMLPTPHRSPRNHERTPKVPILLNDVLLPVKSFSIDVATITTSFISSASNNEGVLNSTFNDEGVAGTLVNEAMDKIIDDIFIIKQSIEYNRGIFHGQQQEGDKGKKIVWLF